MNAANLATTHRDALIAVGWTCGPLVVAADGSVGFVVHQPAQMVGTGRKATIKPANVHTRSFDASGTMTVVR